MNIRTELQEIKGRVDHALDSHLSKVVEGAQKEDELMGKMLAHTHRAMLAGGKRVRPAMVLQGYAAADGVEKRDAITQVAVGVEYVHAFLLMHDDIIDRDDIRHSTPTMHAYCRDNAHQFFAPQYDAIEREHFGRSAAIVVGDYLFALGNEMIYTADFPAEDIVRAMRVLQKVTRQTSIGEFQDVAMEYARDVTREQILSMYENKTARYTFEGPLHVGAVLAGASETFLKQLSAFAVPLGIAFQIQDDMLGVYGDTEKTGKSVGSDVAEGKVTLIAHEALSRADKVQRARLEEVLGKKGLTEDELQDFIEITEMTGARTHVSDEMQKYLQEAREKLSLIPLQEKQKVFFEGLVQYLESRDV